MTAVYSEPVILVTGYFLHDWLTMGKMMTTNKTGLDIKTDSSPTPTHHMYTYHTELHASTDTKFISKALNSLQHK